MRGHGLASGVKRGHGLSPSVMIDRRSVIVKEMEF